MFANNSLSLNLLCLCFYSRVDSWTWFPQSCGTVQELVAVRCSTWEGHGSQDGLERRRPGARDVAPDHIQVIQRELGTPYQVHFGRYSITRMCVSWEDNFLMRVDWHFAFPCRRSSVWWRNQSLLLLQEHIPVAEWLPIATRYVDWMKRFTECLLRFWTVAVWCFITGLSFFSLALLCTLCIWYITFSVY